jgi:soluble lytic murein transglycosylase-like protein
MKKLSKTQILTARGAMILGATVGTAAILGMAGTGPINDRLYVGTLDIRTPPAAVTYELDSALSQLADARVELARARRLIDYSTKYNIPADLAATIYDIANDVDLDPELAFRIVNHESSFTTRAVSSAGAFGLAQVQPRTARFYVPDITSEQLFDREINLRIGFQYLQDLRSAFNDDLPLALIAYNRGPARLRDLLAGGEEPWNGYASRILDGYEPADAESGTLQ